MKTNKDESKMKKPLIFMMGLVYDMNSLTLEELENALTVRLNEIRPGCKISVSENPFGTPEPGDHVRYYFTFERGNGIPMYCYIRYDEEGFMVDSDAALLVGGNTADLTFYQFLLPDSGHPSVKIMEFEEHLQNLCKEAGASEITGIEIEQTHSGLLGILIEYPETY